MAAATVGELLHAADRECRAVLWDAGALDAIGLAGAWADFIAASAAALAAIPNPSLPAAVISARLNAHAREIARTNPPKGIPDARLEYAAALTWHAQSLLGRHATPATTLGDARRADADAARLRIIQTVYIAAHGVALALREAHADPVGAPCGLRSLGGLVDVTERVAGSYVQRHVSALSGEHVAQPDGDGLRAAIATGTSPLTGPCTVTMYQPKTSSASLEPTRA